MKEKEALKGYIKEEKLKKIFAKVFDKRTIMAVHSLANKGLFEGGRGFQGKGCCWKLQGSEDLQNPNIWI